MALELAGAGRVVTMLDRVPQDEASGRIAAVSAVGSCSYRQVDVTDRAAVDAALAAIEPLDVAIGNAGHRRGGAVPRGLAGAVAGASRHQRDRAASTSARRRRG